MMISRSVLLLFVFGLVACGGSGGGSDNLPSTSSASTSSIDSSSVATASSQSSSALASEAGSSALSSSSNSSSVESIIPIFGTVYYEGAESIVDVRAVCHDGSDVATSITMHDFGDYGINVKETALPCFLQAKFKAPSITLHSYVFESGTANITALTDLTLAFYLNDFPETAFSALQENMCDVACAFNQDEISQDESLIRQALAEKRYLYDSSFATSKIIDGDSQGQALSDLSRSIQNSPNLDYSLLLVLIKDGNLNSFPENINAQSSSSSSQSYSSMSSSNDSSSISSSTSSSSSISSNPDNHLLIVTVTPEYPITALENGIEGFCTVVFTVTEVGSTRDVNPVEDECTTKDGELTTIFNRASVRAAQRFKYKPKILDGVPVEVPDVRHRFVFELPDNDSSSVSSSSSSSSSTSDSNLTEGQTFLAANKEKEGVVTTESGLQYRIVTEGTGVKPTVADSVTVHYSGKLLDGTEFDSSYARQQPATVPVNSVIAGWKEALQLMPQGSKWELYIPADLAYGPGGNGPIPPNSTLIFEVELLEVSRR